MVVDCSGTNLTLYVTYETFARSYNPDTWYSTTYKAWYLKEITGWDLKESRVIGAQMPEFYTPIILYF